MLIFANGYVCTVKVGISRNLLEPQVAVLECLYLLTWRSYHERHVPRCPENCQIRRNLLELCFAPSVLLIFARSQMHSTLV